MRLSEESDTGKWDLNTSVVLVAVLKSPADLRRLLDEHWYRIPVDFAPSRSFSYIAFYQPAIFGSNGKQIRYYARVASRDVAKRIELLPDESNHPRVQAAYIRFGFNKIHTLRRPIKNQIPRRVNFGFTTLKQLRTAENLLEVYGVSPTEQLLAEGLDRLGIPVTSEYPVGYSSGRFRIDLVVACRNGWLAIECDNDKAHGTSAQKEKDRHKDMVLGYHGWRILRLTETDIMNNLDRSLLRIQVAIASLGGISDPIN